MTTNALLVFRRSAVAAEMTAGPRLDRTRVRADRRARAKCNLQLASADAEALEKGQQDCQQEVCLTVPHACFNFMGRDCDVKPAWSRIDSTETARNRGRMIHTLGKPCLRPLEVIAVVSDLAAVRQQIGSR